MSNDIRSELASVGDKTVVAIAVPANIDGDLINQHIDSLPAEWSEYDVVIMDEGPYNARRAALQKGVLELALAPVRNPGTFIQTVHFAALGGFAVPSRGKGPKANVNKRCPICGTDVGKGRAGRKCKSCREQTGD